jgi:outer membrane protein assembly factor BamB
LRKVWSVDGLCTGKNTSSWSAPAVAGGRLVVPGRQGDKDVVFCLDAATGRELWKKEYAAPGELQYGSGARATPCIDGGRVYTFGAMGHLACWKLADGEKVWLLDVRSIGGKQPKWGFASSPLLAKGRIIVQAGGTAGAVAVDKATGEVAWKSPTGKAGYAAPILAEVGGKEQLIVFPASGLVGLDPDSGRRLWDWPHITPYDMNCATPIVAGKDRLLIASAARGAKGGCVLLKLTEKAAKLLWRSRAIANYHADPVVVGDSVYLFSGWPLGDKGQLVCASLSDGTIQWTEPMGCGSVLFVDGLLMCMSNRGRLSLVKPDPKRMSKLTEFQAIGGHPVWTVPVIARGRLYVRSSDKLICYSLK